jgi:hypothetical protein
VASVRAVIRRNARLRLTKPVWELYLQPRLAAILRADSVSTSGRYLYVVLLLVIYLYSKSNVPRYSIVLI